MLNAIVKNEHMFKGRSIYNSAVWLQPFWNLKDIDMITRFDWFYRMQLQVGGDQAMCAEVDMNPTKVPEHLHHWVYDRDNRIQRRFYPVRNVVTWLNEIKQIGQMIETSEASGGFLQGELMPSLVIWGQVNPICC